MVWHLIPAEKVVVKEGKKFFEKYRYLGNSLTENWRCKVETKISFTIDKLHFNKKNFIIYISGIRIWK